MERMIPMKSKVQYVFLIISLCFSLVSAAYPSLSSEMDENELQTVAESSGFRATSLYTDVLAFVNTLKGSSPFLRLETLCVSSEGRKVPLLVLGDPPPTSPLELRHDTRLVVYIQANIHAGEVEGKEASLMLARDILLDKNFAYLDRLVILIAPIFNADGNEKISKENRRNQVGPEEGVGVRCNGQNLDLNRDAIKMESPEVQGLARGVLNRWDPVLLIDCHTTNGSYHKEPVTYVWPLNPNGDLSLISHMRESMMPWVNKTLKDKYQTLSIPYGNFMDFKDPEKGWQPAGPQCRYITNYIGLRNRMALLLENYAYADYKTRVYGNYYFLRAVLDYCYAHNTEIQHLIQKADQRMIQKGSNPEASDTFATSYDLKPLKEPLTILGWEMEASPETRGYPRVRRTEVERTYTVPYYCDYIPKTSIAFPFAYLVTVNDTDILAKLGQHGISVEKLTSPVTLEVDSFKITEIKGSERLYQGHRMNSVKGEYATETKDFPAGTILIRTAQPLGNLVAYLLEAESDDGLLVWNYFDKYIVPQWGRGPQTYPVYRLLKPAVLPSMTLR
jgi:dipeptidyl-peptidase-4